MAMIRGKGVKNCTFMKHSYLISAVYPHIEIRERIQAVSIINPEPCNSGRKYDCVYQ